MYSPAAIEKAPAARPASPASSTALLSLVPPVTPAISAKLDTRPSEAPKTAGRSQPPVTSECSCPIRWISAGALSVGVDLLGAGCSARLLAVAPGRVAGPPHVLVGRRAGLRRVGAGGLELLGGLAAGAQPGGHDDVGDRAEEDDQAGPLVEPQPEHVVGRVDPQALDPAAAHGVGGDVEREGPAVPEPEPAVRPDHQDGDADVPQQLVEEGRVVRRQVQAWRPAGASGSISTAHGRSVARP